MKIMSGKFLFLIAAVAGLVLFVIFGIQKKSSEEFKAPKTLEFDGVTYSQAFNQKASHITLWGYLPEGEAPQNYTRRINLLYVSDPSETSISVAETVVENLKRMDPQAPYFESEHGVTGERVLDYIVENEKGIEQDIFKISTFPDGVLAFQFAWRAKKRNADAFVQEVKANRTRLLNLVAERQLYDYNR